MSKIIFTVDIFHCVVKACGIGKGVFKSEVSIAAIYVHVLYTFCTRFSVTLEIRTAFETR